MPALTGLVLGVAHAAIVLATSSSKKSTPSSNGSVTLLIFIAIIALAYFLLIRPQRQRTRRQQQQNSQIEVGDEVLTIGGIIGTVLSMEDDRVTIITHAEAPGADGTPGHHHQMTVLRQAIARKLEPTINPEDAELEREAGMTDDEEPDEVDDDEAQDGDDDADEDTAVGSDKDDEDEPTDDTSNGPTKGSRS